MAKTKVIANAGDMSRGEWLELRKEYIGGSDAGTCLGVNPYSDLLTLWAEKQGIKPDKSDNEAMRQGRDLEQYVADRFMEESGLKVRRDRNMYVSEEHPWMLADLDRQIVGEDAFLECKTMSPYSKYDLANGEIPKSYAAQVTHYMAVMGYSHCYIAFLVFGRMFKWFKIERSENDIHTLVDAEKDFWDKYILTNTQPPADGSDSSIETLRELYPADDGGEMTLSAHDEALVQNLMDVKDAIKRLNENKTEIEAELEGRLKKNSFGYGSQYEVTWKAQTSSRIDAKKLKKEMPDVYEKYSKSNTYRVLRTKKL